MTHTAITTGSRVKTKDGLATVIYTKGRWVHIKFDDGSEKNVGFKDVTICEKGKEGLPKNGVVDPAARARYVRTKIGDGLVSVDNGDEVATALRGMEIDDIYAVASKILKVAISELRATYSHLNTGMQRMNLGNRIRKAIRNDASLMSIIG